MWRALPGILFLLSHVAAAHSSEPGGPGPADIVPVGGPLRLESVREQCIEFSMVDRKDLADCRVSEFGEIGTVGDAIYYYAIYCMVPQHGLDRDCLGDSPSYHRVAAAVFTGLRSSPTVRLLLERATSDIGLFRFEKPEIVRRDGATLLYVPITLDGTGHGNMSEYYVRERRKWRRIESNAWVAQLQKKIPPEFDIRKGVWPDLHTMTAEVPLYGAGDANCCPSAAYARVRLSIEDRRFVIKSVTVESVRE